MRLLRPMLCWCLAASALGCHFEVRPPSDAARDREAIRAVVARMHDAAGAAHDDLAQGLFWSGATVALPPGTRREWIAPVEEGLARAYPGAREVTPVRSEVRLLGNRAVALVEVRVDPGTPAEWEGTEVVLLQRVAGIWRITHLSPAP